MADEETQSQDKIKKREELDKARQQKEIPSRQVPYENRQLTPGRDGQTITR